MGKRQRQKLILPLPFWRKFDQFFIDVNKMIRYYNCKITNTGGVDMQKRYQILMAKTDRNSEEMWLPLWMHLRDTAGVMKRLVSGWVSESVFSASKLEYEQFSSAAVFLAATHDIGKATSYFQNMITESCMGKREEITGRGFLVNTTRREEGKTPHAHAGQWILQSDVTGFGVHESLAMVVGAHHGKPIGADSVMGEPDLLQLHPINFFGRKSGDEAKALWKEAWGDILSQALELAGVQTVSDLPILTLEAQVLLSGLLIIADWIASNTDFFPPISLEDYGDERVYPERIRKGWARAAFPDRWHSKVERMDQEKFEKRFGFLPNEVQKCMLEVVNNTKTPGIFVLEAQMGVGKTEAALGAAEILASKKQEGGIFYGLPTQATSNGLFRRLYQWGVKVSEKRVHAIRLVHGSAEFNEDYHQLIMKGRAYVDDDGQDNERIEVNPWFQGSKRALLADFVIGTVDQFLMASLRRKHFMLRHMGLAGKVVVIDECHAYDAYMNQYLERSLQWMAAYGVPVILLSATLPFERRKALVECYAKAYSRYYLKKKKQEITCVKSDWKKHTGYPLLTWTDGETIGQAAIEQNIPDKTVKIRHADGISDMIELLDDRLQEGGCACIIVNTVKAAQKIYEECSSRMENVNLVLCHAQFIMPDRYKKEQILLEKMGKSSKDADRTRFILIGTQVLEQSLDYDADIMVTQLCPMDLLLQRIGRLHRHERDGRNGTCSRPGRLQNPECIILREDGESYDEGTRAVYRDYFLMRTEHILPEEIKIPGDISNLVQRVYDDEDDLGIHGEMYMAAQEQREGRIRGKREGAKNYLLKSPVGKTMQAILDNLEGSSEKMAEARVRDGVSSIEVLLMKRGKDGEILFLGEEMGEDSALSPMRVPDSEQGRKIAMQRLKLPHVFCAECSDRDDIVSELKEKNKRELPEWQLSPWLQEEVILVLDQENRGELNGYTLRYSLEKGLEYERLTIKSQV